MADNKNVWQWVEDTQQSLKMQLTHEPRLPPRATRMLVLKMSVTEIIQLLVTGPI